jgi:hypothetical protein
MGSDDPIAIIQKLIAADPFQPFSVQVGGKTFYIEEAWHWESLNGEFDAKDIVEIRPMNKLDNYYDNDEYERAQRAAASDPKEYKKLIRGSPEWEGKREEVFEVRGRECEECGATKYLQVHHRYYILDGRDPWDYEMDAFIVLCRKCHKAHHPLLRSAKTGGSKKKTDLAQGELW